MNPLRSIMLALQRIPTPVLLLIFVVLAGLAAFTVNNYMAENKKQTEEQKANYQAEYNAKEAALNQKLNQKSKVVFSVKDILEGSTIAADSLEEKDVTGQVSPDALSGMTSAVGRIAKYNIPAGQLISAHDLVAVGTPMGFEAKVKEGYRAVTFGVDNNTGVAGFISPGSHVDIIAATGSAENTKAKPILSDVEVIAVGQIYQKATASTQGQAPAPASSVTVTVRADDANKLIKGIIAGRLYLTLRNSNDHTPVAIVDVNSLFDKSAGLSMSPLPLPPGVPSTGAGPTLPPLHEIELWTGSKKRFSLFPKIRLG